MNYTKMIGALSALAQTDDAGEAAVRLTAALGLPELGRAIDRASHEDSAAAAMQIVVAAVSSIDAKAVEAALARVDAMYAQANTEDRAELARMMSVLTELEAPR